MKYQKETLEEYHKITNGTMAQQSMRLGLAEAEPLLVAMDAMLRYAKAYKKAYDAKLFEDGVLGPEFGMAIAGIRGLLNGNGAVAMERNITTDSKDNGVIESLYWKCCEVGGFNGDNL